jgi:hypothetical protein
LITPKKSLLGIRVNLRDPSKGGENHETIMILAALMPLAALAQPINTMNNPNQPGYVVPSQQRMQTEMMSQQQQQRDAESAAERRPDAAAAACKTR